jgi:hypothetical protein
MRELGKYIEKRKAKDKDFAKGYDEGYSNFKSNVMRKLLQKKSGLVQKEDVKF